MMKKKQHGSRALTTILFFLLASVPTTLTGIDFQSDIRLNIPPSIIAHPSGSTIILTPGTPSERARGNGFAGWFDSNMPTTLTYQANSLHHEEEESADIIPTHYDVTLYGHGGADIYYESPVVEHRDIRLLPGSSQVEPTTGKIYAALDVEAEVGWEHDAGHYESVYIITAVQSGGITADEINLYKSFFYERDLPQSAVIDSETDPNLYLNSDISMSPIFIGEGAGYKNRVGYFLFGDSDNAAPGALEVIYENASMAGSGGTLLPGDTQPGEIVNSDFNIGFWIQSNGFGWPGAPFYYTLDNYNADGLRHAAVFSDIARSRIIIGFEDLPGGGDQDYNDVLFALDIFPFSALDLSNIPDVQDLTN